LKEEAFETQTGKTLFTAEAQRTPRELKKQIERLPVGRQADKRGNCADEHGFNHERSARIFFFRENPCAMVFPALFSFANFVAR